MYYCNTKKYQKIFLIFFNNGNKRYKTKIITCRSSTALQLTAKKLYAEMLPARRQDGKSAGKFGEEFLQVPQLW